MSDTVPTGLKFDEQPVDDQDCNEVRIVVDEGNDRIDMRCTGDEGGTGTTVRMSQLDVIELITSLTRALHVATRNGLPVSEPSIDSDEFDATCGPVPLPGWPWRAAQS